MSITHEEHEALKGCLEAVLVVADAHSLSLTAARISGAIDPLASEAGPKVRASSPSPVLQRSSDHAPELHEPVSRPTGGTAESRLAPMEESRLESLEESHGQ